MTHLPFIAASYGLFVLLALWLSISATLRLRTAKRRLRALDAALAAPGVRP
ncbi:heme exporter protein CcmD [Rhizosaccharibacter radicis]|uniref:Heme exporter protein D n=1 Tax=Rhizosaccharibacter radicis TaxID=2782605 RepID=A0ABT1VXQ3_9PROT|nr:heme exporter protein CcmD [Acetobacteraceae bacterium KSS12]